MSKYVLTLIVCLNAGLLYSGDDLLNNYVPKDADGIVSANIKNALEYPILKELIESPEATTNLDLINLKNKFKANGLELFESFSSALFYFRIEEKNGAGILRTTMKEAIMKNILESPEFSKWNFKSATEEGTTIYSISPNIDGGNISLIPLPFAFMPHFNFTNTTLFFSYGSPDILLVSKDKALVLEMLKYGKKPEKNIKLDYISSKLDKDATLWGALSIKNEKNTQEADEDSQGLAQQFFPIDNIRSASWVLKIEGEKKDSLSANLNLSCKDAFKAQMFSQMLQLLSASSIANLHKHDQILSSEIMNSLKIENVETDIVIKFMFTSSIQDKLKKLLEQKLLSEIKTLETEKKQDNSQNQ